MRLIAGDLRGRALVAPRGAATRPTSDRVREALFSIIGDVGGLRVLDLYAGTGALGIEALSRGAAYATFVEHAREPLRALRRNLRDLGIEQKSRVLPVRVERLRGARSLLGESFDIVFVDPPYRALRDEKVVDDLGRLFSEIRPGARVVVEHARSLAAPEFSGLALDDRRSYGDTALGFYVRSPSP